MIYYKLIFNYSNLIIIILLCCFLSISTLPSNKFNGRKIDPIINNEVLNLNSSSLNTNTNPQNLKQTSKLPIPKCPVKPIINTISRKSKNERSFYNNENNDYTENEIKYHDIGINIIQIYLDFIAKIINPFLEKKYIKNIETPGRLDPNIVPNFVWKSDFQRRHDIPKYIQTNIPQYQNYDSIVPYLYAGNLFIPFTVNQKTKAIQTYEPKQSNFYNSHYRRFNSEEKGPISFVNPEIDDFNLEVGPRTYWEKDMNMDEPVGPRTFWPKSVVPSDEEYHYNQHSRAHKNEGNDIVTTNKPEKPLFSA